MTQYPKYVSHKVVEAFKIENISHPAPHLGAYLVPGAHLMAVGGAVHVVSVEYMEKHKPQIGGYWVRYADGYESWSPAEAFESGYKLV